MADGIRAHSKFESYVISRKDCGEQLYRPIYDWVDKNLTRTVHTEMAVIYDPEKDSVRYPTGQEAHARRGSGPSDMYTILDILHLPAGEWESKTAEVVDLKFGAKAKAYNKAEGHEQLAFYALAASRLGFDVRRVGLVFRDGTDEWAPVTESLHRRTKASLQIHLSLLSKSEPRPGRHCMLCPMATVCSATPNWIKERNNAKIGSESVQQREQEADSKGKPPQT